MNFKGNKPTHGRLYCIIFILILVLIGMVLYYDNIMQDQTSLYRSSTNSSSFTTDPIENVDSSISHQSSMSRKIPIIDRLNRTVILNQSPHKIVVLNGRFLDFIIAFKSEDKVIGIPDYILKQEQYMKHVPTAVGIGGSMEKVNGEQIVSLHPDLVIAYSKSPLEDEQRITNAHIPIVYLDCHDITDISDEARIFGKILNKEDIAENYIAFNKKYFDLIDSRLAEAQKLDNPSVYIALYSNFIGMGASSYGNKLIERLHGINIAGNVQLEYPTLNKEWIISENPDVIFKFVSISDLPEKNILQKNYAEFINLSGFSNISALKSKNVYVVNSYAVASPRGIAGVMYLAKCMYPQIFQDIDPESVLHDYAAKFQPDGDHMITFYPNCTEE